jgi:amidase
VRSLEEVIRFNEENSHRVMPYFGQEHMVLAQETKSLRDKKYRDALAKNLRLTRKEGIDAAMRKHKLEAIVVPSGGPAWLIDLVDGDSNNWDMESTSPAAVAGYPHITVPAGYIFGLPVGLSFFAQAWQEPALIRFAYAFEQATQFRRQPRYLPTATLNP